MILFHVQHAGTLETNPTLLASNHSFGVANLVGLTILCFIKNRNLTGISIAMRSIENIPQHKNFKVFLEKVLAIVVLVLELNALRIPALGLVKSDGIVGAVIKSKKAMQKERRGSMESQVSKY